MLINRRTKIHREICYLYGGYQRSLVHIRQASFRNEMQDLQANHAIARWAVAERRN
jgi:hypothetical protein